MKNYYSSVINSRKFTNIPLIYLNFSIACMFTYSILAYLRVLPIMNSYNITLFSVIIVGLIFISFFISGNKYGLSAALLTYTVLTQFGMSTIYYLFGAEYLDSFSNTTLRFLSSSQYEKAILLGIIAISSLVIGSRIGYLSTFKIEKSNKIDINNKNESKYTYLFGSFLLILVMLYLFMFMLTGKIHIGMSYHSFLRSGIVNGLYPWVLLMYSVGICFIGAVGNKKQIQIGLFLFLIPAAIFFSTGNRGEVLYSLLAFLGIIYYRDQKIKLKYILSVFFLLFLIIPFIRLARNTGTVSGFDLLSLNYADAFAEMGHQLRLTVLILEEFSYGSRELLMGYSYSNPLINILDRIIPLDISLVPPLDFNFSENFPGLGFSQIAESLANFGVVGVIGFYFILGFVIRKAESKNLEGLSLALWGAILAVLINATRNRFAFVPGFILIIIFFVIFIKFIANKKRKKKNVRTIKND